MGHMLATRYKIAIASLGLVGVLVACEHAHYWRNAEPWETSFRKDMADPTKAKAEMISRMAPRAGEKPYESKDAALAASAGCISCHTETDHFNAHPGDTPAISCVDCHGGNGEVKSTMDKPGRPGVPGTPITDSAYLAAMIKAHVSPRNPQAWYGSPTIKYGDHHGEHGEEHAEGGNAEGEHAEGDTKETVHGSLHGSRNPEATAALLNQESPEFIRFMNPGDLRVAEWACGKCHAQEVAFVGHSMMAHGSQLWGAALYNNGSIPNKISAYGESYSPFGLPQRLQGVIEADSNGIQKVRKPTDEEVKRDGVVPWLEPLPVWAITQPGNILRVFERGTKLPVPGGAVPNEEPGAIGLPNPLSESGKADKGLSPRGLGTKIRTDPVFLGLQKTRLLDPILNMMGTNDHPGDFRQSGCTACHTSYANDRSVKNSGKELAAKGNKGFSSTSDPTIAKNESGHPDKHVLSNAIPTSQCIVCHVHPGTSYANTYTGYMWWDLESDGEFMYPNRTSQPTPEQRWESLRKNPDDAAIRGLWGNLYPSAVNHKGEAAGTDFLEKTGSPEFNAKLQHNQFADFHGHGWMFRAIHKKDRTGNLLDGQGNVIDPNDPDKWKKAVHLADLHLDAGMHCIDCHFKQDMHGNGKLYAEVRNAVEIRCQDCHGDYNSRATLKTSGPAAPRNDKGEVIGTSFERTRVFGKPRFYTKKDGTLWQRSAVEKGLEWPVVQTMDTINPASAWAIANPKEAAKSRYAKTVFRDESSGQIRWGDTPKENGPKGEGKLAHSMDKVECFTCHTSWMTSCAGCHLPMLANERTPMLHNENKYTRNYTRYNFQVLRDDTYQLGRDSTVKGGKVVPVRSSSAVIVSSQNLLREWIYSQQQTISAEGYSGQAFNPHFPHATAGRGTTKMCIDCHASRDGDNNAWMAQLLLQGTNMVNFIGRFAYVAEGSGGLEGVVVTEHEEPQAVLGSYFQSLAWPDEYKKFVEEDKRELELAYHHDGKGAFGWLNGAEILDLQLRGEYLYAARGSAGFYVFDVQAIDHKGFSERIVTAPVSPLGQRLGFDTENCVAIASPTTLGVDPARTRMSNDPSQPRAIGLDEPKPWHVNQEQKIHPMYAYLYIGDSKEGLITTFAGTLLDGDPENNFLERTKFKDGTTAFNPDGVLTGMTHLVLAGHYVYATSPRGLVVIDIDDPTDPKLVKVAGSDVLVNPQAVQVQFRYAFVTDAGGLKVFDVTEPGNTEFVGGSALDLPGEKHRLYVARTYAYVACGSAGMAIVDVTKPGTPTLVTQFTGDGELKDTRDVKVGMTNASMFAYIADGKGGFKVAQLMGPNTTAQFRGFAPPLNPQIIARRSTHGPALAVSKGLDRDRAVDESGNQTSVFGRLGARPLNLSEQRKMYLHNGVPWTVTNEPDGAPEAYTLSEPAKKEEEKPAEGGGRRRGR
jgi:cytochrome c551/c552